MKHREKPLVTELTRDMIWSQTSLDSDVTGRRNAQ